MASKSGKGLSRILWAALTLCLGSVGCHATVSFMETTPEQTVTPCPSCRMCCRRSLITPLPTVGR